MIQSQTRKLVLSFLPGVQRCIVSPGTSYATLVSQFHITTSIQSWNVCRQLFDMNLRHHKNLYIACDIYPHMLNVCTVTLFWVLLSLQGWPSTLHVARWMSYKYNLRSLQFVDSWYGSTQHLSFFTAALHLSLKICMSIKDCILTCQQITFAG